jgi:hypothetical protein
VQVGDRASDADAQHAREVAEAEAVDDQREQQLDAAYRPFAGRARDEAGEGGGQFVEGFIERFVHGALVFGGAGCGLGAAGEDFLLVA